VHRDVREVAVEPVPPPPAAPFAANGASAPTPLAGPTAASTLPASSSAGTSNGISDVSSTVGRNGVSGVTVDWSGDYLAAARTTSAAIAMELPTFIIVQSQLSGDRTTPAG
jgi:hypothetical protein